MQKNRPFLLQANPLLQKAKWVSNYYCFGSLKHGRYFSGDNGYKWGFNGKEKDKESFPDAYDFGARIYDGRLGRFLSPDPLDKLYCWQSAYTFAANTPTKLIEIDGKGPGDVLIAFGGADFFFAGKVGSVNGIINYVNRNDFIGRGGYAKAFSSSLFLNALVNEEIMNIITQDAYETIKAKYNKDATGNDLGPDNPAKIIIYGYSWGGVLAQGLTDRLKKENIIVDLLVTVDEAAGIHTDLCDRTVSSNVKENLNIYQTNPSSIGLHGDANTADSKTTAIENSNYSNTFIGEPGTESYTEVNHSNIDEITQSRVSKKIVTTVSRKKE